uniref:Uncharacterized protein n=1 Tax=Cacopsylla melanoneura TaxID=428564 RepID=A0A8D9F8X3_9HEMI
MLGVPPKNTKRARERKNPFKFSRMGGIFIALPDAFICSLPLGFFPAILFSQRYIGKLKEKDDPVYRVGSDQFFPKNSWIGSKYTKDRKSNYTIQSNSIHY